MTPNRLAAEQSAYLKSAGHQPVAWFPWSDEAFRQAKALDRPILLDIGAVWCHWCHVMDHESYENAEIAQVINDHFIPIKVDRDERPDIDVRYQMAVGAIAGQGGWPLTAFLTPEGEVFFGGTYFPPDDRHGRPGLKVLLRRIAELYQHKREELAQEAKTLHERLKTMGRQASHGPGDGDPRAMLTQVVPRVVEATRQAFDFVYGGFGRAPKFPHASTLALALAEYAVTREEWLRVVVTKTLEGMARGGIYDQLGGGFHRYSVDERWVVPHFEKMAYDNAELLRVYLQAYQVMGTPLFREIAEGIIGYVDACLSDRERGGFYASQDADISMTDDGDAYTWTREEARACLSKDEADILLPFYDIEERGEMHQDPARNVLFVAASPEALAAQAGLSVEEVHRRIVSGRQRLLEARRRRPAPFVDRAIYTNWNGMFISAYLTAYRVLGREDCLAFALTTIDRLLREAYDPTHGPAHTLTDGVRVSGLLDDHCQLGAAALEAYEVTLEPRYLDAAEALMDRLLARFWDAEAGGFFDTEAPEHGGTGEGIMSLRHKPIQDTPSSSSNATAGLLLSRLWAHTQREVYREKAEALLKAFLTEGFSYGLFVSAYAQAVEVFLHHPLQIVIVGDRHHPATHALHRAALRPYRLGAAIIHRPSEGPSQPPSRPIPGLLATAMAGRAAPGSGRAVAYVCSGSACAEPTSDAERLMELVRAFGLEA